VGVSKKVGLEWIWLGVAVLAGAFALRLVGVQAKALWWDEGITVFLANLTPAEYLDLRWMDIHPPLYRLVMLGWVRVAGSGDFAVRFLSVGLGVVAVALTCQLGKRLLGARGGLPRPRGALGLLAAALLAASPFALFHSQEAKMYPLLLALTALALVAAERLFAGERGPAWWAALVGAGVLALWTHYYAATTLAAINGAYVLLWLGGKKGLPAPRAWVAAQVLTLFLFLPWILLEGGRIPADADRTIGGSAPAAPLAFLVEIGETLAAGYPQVGTAAGAVWAVIWFGMAVIGVGYVGNRDRGTRGRGDGESGERGTGSVERGDVRQVRQVWGIGEVGEAGGEVGEEGRGDPIGAGGTPAVPAGDVRQARRAGFVGEEASGWGLVVLMGLAVGVPVGIGVLVSLRFPYDAPRFFLVCAPPLAVLVAAGCAVLARWSGVAGRGAAVAVVGLALLGALAVYRQPSLTDDYRPLVAQLVAAGRPDDPVLCGYPWQVGYLRAYAPDRGRPVFPLPEDFERYAEPGGRLWVLTYRTPEDGDYLRARLEARGLRRTLAVASGESRIALYERD
jgi:hypothetical protein